ncbi:DUF4184 family protein [Pontibacter sp. 13R65]|uniref:DUF4184 family protein n=1 Tax=Pontibacter sp. 13R65 TaxID=3127458 RepID=UPI00301C66DE
MPFTAAHPAIILPLLKLRSRWFSTTGLVLGSVAPDFEYFFRLRIVSKHSHELSGILLFNVPVTFLLAILFHSVVRDMAKQHLPHWLRSRALAVRELNWLQYLRKHWLVFLVSAAIGAASHVFWDGFTHPKGYFVGQLPVLLTPLSLFGKDIPLCRILQHLSTVAGGLLLFWYCKTLPVLELPKRVSKQPLWFYFWIKVFLVGCAFLLVNVFARPHLHRTVDFVVILIGGWLLALVLAGVKQKQSPG